MPQPTLYTERMVLIPLTDEHLEYEVELDSDPEVLRYIEGRARTREEVAGCHAQRMELGRRVDGLGYWLATETTGEFVGVMMLPPAERPGEAELGYRLLRRYWRRGLATEGAVALLRHGFATSGRERIIAQTMTVNSGSRRVMEKCGLRYVRTFFPDHPPIPGSGEGEVEYAITRAEWRAVQRLVILVDDLRSFADGRPAEVARTSAEGVALLEAHRGRRIDELWLDHDLGGEDTIWPVVEVLERAAFEGRPIEIDLISVHSANPVGAARIRQALDRCGYRVRAATGLREVGL
ncbi:hypothetical protein Aca07nite_63970 [Actinoplanes capillaceus]|uniref:N-acetyltransferase domain-containing protein n=1 Tax=Actinoplanes campanulatus TaxID=113559 RepID=A0ABQ3WS97_9ACTN|nr:hypothetical protein Aca07nite_63970 [Actinoplanes capillaceus]